MTRVGITGHQSIPTTALTYIRSGLRQLLQAQPEPLIGISSLAVGADQLFAQEILDAGGVLHVVVPSAGYERTFGSVDRGRFLTLKMHAEQVEVLKFAEPTDEAFNAAGERIAELCDVMAAIWDGQGARGQGGTADAVEHARRNKKPVHIIWPAGVSRS